MHAHFFIDEQSDSCPRYKLTLSLYLRYALEHVSVLSCLVKKHAIKQQPQQSILLIHEKSDEERRRRYDYTERTHCTAESTVVRSLIFVCLCTAFANMALHLLYFFAICILTWLYLFLQLFRCAQSKQTQFIFFSQVKSRKKVD